MLDLLLTFLLSANVANAQVNLPVNNENEQKSTVEEQVIVKKDSSRPYIQASSALIMDLESQQILFQQNIHEKRQIASLTKLMTALVILEENELTEVATVPLQAVETEGSTMYLVEGEQITIEDLLKGLLIMSGNDAAVTLAIHNSGSIENFVKKMNQKAKELALENTHFSNPMGFDNPQNYSTAYEMAILAKVISENDIVQQITSTKTTKIKSADNQFTHTLANTNQLLGNYLGVIGLKTGHTYEAGGCFIGITGGTHPQISVVLGSSNRFNESKILLDWAKNSFNYL